MGAQSFLITGDQVGLPSLVHISQTHSQVASRVTWHSHAGYELLFLIEGTTTYEFTSHETVELRGGHFLVIPPGVVHRGMNNMRSPSTMFGLVLNPLPHDDWKGTPFTADDMCQVRQALERGGQRVHPFSSILRWLVLRLVQESGFYAAGEQSIIYAPMAIRALISGVLLGVMRQMLNPPTEPKQFVSAAIAYLRQHLDEPVQMTDLVRHVGYSRARLFDIFKAQTGLTPNDYRQRLRVERCQELLRTTEQSITEIAHATGFSSGQYFSTVFSRYTGISPSDYRKSNQKPTSRKTDRAATKP